MVASVNRGKQSIMLTLKDPSVRAFLRRVANARDVVLTGDARVLPRGWASMLNLLLWKSKAADIMLVKSATRFPYY